jgi:hypothetical protein
MNKKAKGAAENQRNARLCIAESRKPDVLDNKPSVQCAYTLMSGDPPFENRPRSITDSVVPCRKVILSAPSVCFNTYLGDNWPF